MRGGKEKLQRARNFDRKLFDERLQDIRIIVFRQIGVPFRVLRVLIRHPVVAADVVSQIISADVLLRT